MILFGSASRQEEGAPAPEDADIGALGDAGLDPVDVTNRFIRALGVQAVDISDLRRADPLLLALAARDGVALYEREFARFARGPPLCRHPQVSRRRAGRGA